SAVGATASVLDGSNCVTLPILGGSQFFRLQQAPLEVVTFNYTGAPQSWVVPNGVASVDVDARGAQGGGNGPTTPGGKGGRVQTTLAVTPGETLHIYVGEKGGDLDSPNIGGAGGWNGGGPGGIDNVDFNGP